MGYSVHGANKLAAKHDRVTLSKAAESAQCDICQDRPAVLFCSEDRALICRRCAACPCSAKTPLLGRRSMSSTCTHSCFLSQCRAVRIVVNRENMMARALYRRAALHALTDWGTKSQSGKAACGRAFAACADSAVYVVQV